MSDDIPTPAPPTNNANLTLQRQNEAAVEAIETATKEQPLTSELCHIASLEAQYKNENANFRQGLQILQQDYHQIRRVRGDGNCYIRAFLYAMLEKIRDNAAEATRILNYFQTKSWKDVLSAGYDEMAIEIFYDTVVDLLQRLPSLDEEILHKELNEENSTSDYCTWYLRVVMATYLKNDPNRFLPYLIQQQAPGDCFLDINQFCQRYIEPMGQDCEELQVLALAEAVQVRVQIEYLDGRTLAPNQKLTQHNFGPEESATKLTLLYRPGHYDILYQAEK